MAFVSKKCGICPNNVDRGSRYANYNLVCNDCIANNPSVDINGNMIEFQNKSLSGGIMSITTLPDNTKKINEEYMSYECYINNILCKVTEARFGGIIYYVS